MKTKFVYPKSGGLVHRVRWSAAYGSGRRTLCGRSIKAWSLGDLGDTGMLPRAARLAGRCTACEAVSA